MRPDGRGGGDEYDDYGYADDGYTRSDDENWSPNQYFSPEGIKGKWAGEKPAGRSGGRGRHDEDLDYRDEFDGHDYGTTGSGDGSGYEADEFASGAYDLPDGADEDRGDRRRSRRSREREDRGERTGILRLRRDRGEDIWPDDGISDEDYWASVAADRPLNGTDSPADNFPPAGGGGRSGAGPRSGTDARAGTDSRPGRDPRQGMGGADSRYGGDQRSGGGRLGPPPGLSGDYNPGSGSPGGPSQPGGGRTGSGPMPARPATGPVPVRPGTGPTATVGVTSSRPPAASNGTRPGSARPGSGAMPASGSGGFPQAQARPSFQPNSTRSGGLPSAAPGGGRQQDWGDRTERIERVNASGYPEPRSGGRGQGPGPAGGRGPSEPLGLGTGPSAGPGASGAAGRGRGDNPAWRAPDRREPNPRATGRDGSREGSGAWPTAAPARGAHARRSDDDPLTSKAYSRAAMSETDGRSYRVAARRSEAQTKLTDQAETFLSGQYQQPAQPQPGRGGEYWQYREDEPAPAPQSSGGRYPAPGSQGGHPSQAGRGQSGPGMAGPRHADSGQVAARASQPGFTPSNPGRPGSPSAGTGPGSGLPGGQYEAQQPRPSQQQRPGQQLPAAGPSSGPGGTGPGSGRPAGAGGLNPYDSSVTGSYPYSSPPYAASPAPGGHPQDSTDDPYYRPSPADGYPVGGPSQGRANQGQPSYGTGYTTGYTAGYTAPGDRRY